MQHLICIIISKITWVHHEHIMSTLVAHNEHISSTSWVHHEHIMNSEDIMSTSWAHHGQILRTLWAYYVPLMFRIDWIPSDYEFILFSTGSIGPAAFPIHPNYYRLGPAAFPVHPTYYRLGPAAFPVHPNYHRLGPAAFPILHRIHLQRRACQTENFQLLTNVLQDTIVLRTICSADYHTEIVPGKWVIPLASIQWHVV